MKRYDRDELLAICESAFTSQDNWTNRDSSAAHRQLGECYALLKSGCDFIVLSRGDLATSDHTIWVEVEFRGFGYFDYGGHEETETFYLPTRKRLDTSSGRDWY